ncbi:unnamed protein product [Bursaphelenchus okinawaensis]|uniref:Uncharacterized protein n=1 Tax=Bursaphelenchus okinawaensis TaxID=465554 RepID=A0A811L751_9BILA|nr:unnamed protein product [Bursaphelenchus okinawaensis]CAG9119520.1 unnamed protein product [Bursaphelenchus okinawaensis]
MAYNTKDHKYDCRRFEGKVALLTAATEGIGLATADRLAHEGAKVIISSRNEVNVKRAVQDLIDSGINPKNIAGTVCHVGNPEHRQNLLDFATKTFGKIDILFNNAGINPAIGTMLEVTPSQYDKMYDVNIKATFLMTKIVAQHMKETGGGVVIFNGTFGAFRSLRGVRAYNVLKTALVGITQALAHELGPYNIRINSVHPGLIQTRMGRIMFDPNHKLHHLVDVKGPTFWAIHRMGQPEETAAAVCYLASDEARHVTGENHVISGGCDCRL